jgi:hypothetical protein
VKEITATITLATGKTDVAFPFALGSGSTYSQFAVDPSNGGGYHVILV